MSWLQFGRRQREETIGIQNATCELKDSVHIAWVKNYRFNGGMVGSNSSLSLAPKHGCCWSLSPTYIHTTVHRQQAEFQIYHHRGRSLWFRVDTDVEDDDFFLELTSYFLISLLFGCCLGWHGRPLWPVQVLTPSSLQLDWALKQDLASRERV